MKTIYIIIIFAFILFLTISFFVIKYLRKKENNKLKQAQNLLEIKKNKLESLPVLIEIEKIEEIAKSEQLENKINSFKTQFENAKNEKLTKIEDMLIELDDSIKNRNEKQFYEIYTDIELTLNDVDYIFNNILSEIKEISSYEEKYREIVTKLKTKYRYLDHTFKEKEPMFKDLADTIKMQFENIAKRFKDFDKVIDEKLYNEVVLVVRSLDTMIDNLDIIIKELPDILLLLNDLIPGRIKDLNEEYQNMQNEGYTLGFLNYEENISDIEKKENDILSRAKVLNINNSLFDLRMILEYLDNLFKDLEKEKDAKNQFDQLDNAFIDKKNKLEKVVKDIYSQLDDIKSLYHLNEKDLEIIDQLNLKLAQIIKDYKKLNRDKKKKQESFQKRVISINDLLNRINTTSQEFDTSLRTLGSFYEDEKRAHTEYNDIEEIIKKCRSEIRNFKLPIIHDEYFIQEEEAITALKNVDEEINNKPIVIKNLNMRVETARDLTFKLYKTTNDMTKYAYFTEQLLIYSNKFRNDKNLDKILSRVSDLYYEGKYQESYHQILKAIKIIDEDFANKINKITN